MRGQSQSARDCECVVNSCLPGLIWNWMVGTVFLIMKMKALAPFLLLSLFAASSAWAQAQVFSVSVPTTIANPLGGFTINYTLGGSKYGVGAASAELRFYLSATPDGSSGVWLLSSGQILLNGSGLGPYYPPSGTQSRFVSQANMQASTVAKLQSIVAACQPQSWYILGQLDATAVRYTQSTLGTTKLPDFYFTAGTLSPSVITPGGSADISFDVFTQCPSASPSTVGIYLADASYNLLSYIGGVSVGAGSGTFSLPPTTITFSSSIPTGSYNIVLFADDEWVVAESNENNNAGAFALEVVAPSARRASDGAASELEREAVPADAASLPRGFVSGESHAFIKDGVLIQGH